MTIFVLSILVYVYFLYCLEKRRAKKYKGYFEAVCNCLDRERKLNRYLYVYDTMREKPTIKGG